MREHDPKGEKEGSGFEAKHKNRGRVGRRIFQKQMWKSQVLCLHLPHCTATATQLPLETLPIAVFMYVERQDSPPGDTQAPLE